jgi:DNA-binding XRE family transcriptional regulator
MGPSEKVCGYCADVPQAATCRKVAVGGTSARCDTDSLGDTDSDGCQPSCCSVGAVYSRTGTGAEPGRLSALFGIVAGMARRILDRTYRSTVQLMRAIGDEHVLTQHELAGRTGLSRYQLCRWEKGAREPTLAMVRRLLGEFGLAVTFGVEPSTAALDQRLEAGVDAIGLDAWLLANGGVPEAV